MKKNITVIGVPMNLGQSNLGVEKGPKVIREVGLVSRLEALNHDSIDAGDIFVPEANESAFKTHNLDEIVEANTLLAKEVDEIVSSESFPLVLGGDHSIAIGTLAGLSEHYENLGVIWYDAHADINTADTSPTGNIHGMPLAVCLGLGEDKLVNLYNEKIKIKPENVVIIGARDLDAGERLRLKELNIKTYTMHEVDRLGIFKVINESMDYLKDKTDGVHLSFDLDGVDPECAPGVGTPVVGGLTYRESRLALELLSDSGMITSAEFVEVNPLFDVDNKTAKVAVGLIATLLGEKLI